MSRLKGILKIVVSIPAMLAGIALVVLMLVTVADVLLRAFFSIAVVGSIEISVFVMVCAGFLGMAWCAFGDRHIRVDILVCMLPLRIQKHFFKFNYLAVIIMCALISVYCYYGALEVKMLDSVSQLLRIPNYPFYMVAAFSYFLLSITSLILLIDSFFSKDEEAECGNQHS